MGPLIGGDIQKLLNNLLDQKKEMIMNQTLLITLLMLSAGLLGGITNYFRAEEDKNKLSSFFKNILMGISSALLIPLFLNMISSNLLKESSEDSSKLFILFGFCLIASLSSKAFIQTISDRLLNEVKKTKEKMEDIEKDVAPIISKETEAEGGEDTRSLFQLRAFSFDEESKKVLSSLSSSKYSWRSLPGITKETGLPEKNVLNSLDWLSTNRLVVKTNGKNGTLWGLTLEGRDIHTEISPAK